DRERLAELAHAHPRRDPDAVGDRDEFGDAVLIEIDHRQPRLPMDDRERIDLAPGLEATRPVSAKTREAGGLDRLEIVGHEEICVAVIVEICEDRGCRWAHPVRRARGSPIPPQDRERIGDGHQLSSTIAVEIGGFETPGIDAQARVEELERRRRRAAVEKVELLTAFADALMTPRTLVAVADGAAAPGSRRARRGHTRPLAQIAAAPARARRLRAARRGIQTTGTPPIGRQVEPTVATVRGAL